MKHTLFLVMMSTFVVCHAPDKRPSELLELAIAETGQEESAPLTPREMVETGTGACFDCCSELTQSCCSIAFVSSFAVVPATIITMIARAATGL